MIKEQGIFSQRYLLKRGKENTNHINTHHPQHSEDFPLAYTSAKTHSRERPSISANRKREEKHPQQQELQEKTQKISQLQKELKECREQARKLSKQAQTKYSLYQKTFKQLNQELKQKEEMLEKVKVKGGSKSKLQEQSNRYKQTIKGHIYWLLNFFKMLHEDTKMDDLRREVSQAFTGFKDYISEFAIQKELQALATTSKNLTNINEKQSSTTFSQAASRAYELAPKNGDSIFTEDLQELNMIKIMELQPLIQTFNNQQYCLAPQQQQVQNKMERVTKRLFSQSKFVGESQNCSLLEEEARKHITSTDFSDNQFLPKKEEPKIEPIQVNKQIELPAEVTVIKNFDPDARHDNYIKLKKGQCLKLLRKIRDQLWIGEVGEKIGLVSQDCFEI